MTTEEAQTGKERAVAIERRMRRRYPLHMPLLGRILGDRPDWFPGETVDISSQGVLFATLKAIPAKARIELQIDWPVRTGKGETQQLCIAGIVVRNSRNLIAARIRTHALHAGAREESS